MFSPLSFTRPLILLHGAWHGHWCWYKISPLLQKLGYNVLTPDLPGHYYQRRNFKNIDINTYVYSVQNLIETCQNPVILVGHSMAGLIITQVAENIPEKIAQLIYISGFIPQHGESLITEQAKFKSSPLTKLMRADKRSNTLFLPENAPLEISNLFYNLCSQEDRQYALSHLQPQPLRPFMNRIFISERIRQIPKLYVECLKDKVIDIRHQRQMHLPHSCTTVTLKADHCPFFSAVDPLIEILSNTMIRKSS
jgi:pimeloyl-ACP methyl ester carboxylesterase